jgi:hypothetical protein
MLNSFKNHDFIILGWIYLIWLSFLSFDYIKFSPKFLLILEFSKKKNLVSRSPIFSIEILIFKIDFNNSHQNHINIGSSLTCRVIIFIILLESFYMI